MDSIGIWRVHFNCSERWKPDSFFKFPELEGQFLLKGEINFRDRTPNPTFPDLQEVSRADG
jgi:hypothetical protein